MTEEGGTQTAGTIPGTHLGGSPTEERSSTGHKAREPKRMQAHTIQGEDRRINTGGDSGEPTNQKKYFCYIIGMMQKMKKI